MSERRARRPGPQVIGVTTADFAIDEDAIYRRMVEAYAQAAALDDKRNHQRILFPKGPVGIAEVADLHFGSEGVDYQRVFDEGKMIAETPALYLGFNGDAVDNFILAKMQSARFESVVKIPDEWVLFKRYLRLVAPKLVFAVSGNHDHWFHFLTGIDYFKDVLERFAPCAIYDAFDTRFSLQVGQAQFPCRARHKWRGNSIYNPTHAIERAFLFDQDFTIGFGAHTHASGLCRQMNCAGRTGMALLAGSYKRLDPYAREKGFAKPNGSTAVTVLVDEGGSMVGYDRLEKACEELRLHHRGDPLRG